MSSAQERVDKALAYLDKDCSVSHRCGRTLRDDLKRILTPPSHVWAFGGARFVEIGEREPMEGEYYLDTGGDLRWAWQDLNIVARVLRYAPEAQP